VGLRIRQSYYERADVLLPVVLRFADAQVAAEREAIAAAIEERTVRLRNEGVVGAYYHAARIARRAELDRALGGDGDEMDHGLGGAG
jgi:hypothetical protein